MFGQLLAMALALTPGQNTSPHSSSVCRRSALHGAASIALLSLLPTAAFAVDGQANEIGFSGALRNDIGPSITGSGVEVLISEQSYKELPACPSAFFVPSKGGPWSCLEVTCIATNNGRRKTTSAIEIFGFLFDAEGFAAASTALDPTTKGSPLASIPINIPKGESKTVSFYVAVQQRSPRPFRFGGFKGVYRNAGIEKTFNTFDPCEIDSSKCEEGEDQPENAAAGYLGDGFKYGGATK